MLSDVISILLIVRFFFSMISVIGTIEVYVEILWKWRYRDKVGDIDFDFLIVCGFSRMRRGRVIESLEK